MPKADALETMQGPGERRLVPRFAFTTLCVFAAVGVALWWVMSAIVRERTESTAQEHAEFVTHSVIHPALSEIDVDVPLRLGDPRYEELRDLVVSDVLGVQFPVVRVNVWGSDGTVLFSDEPDLLGRRFALPPGLRSAFGGRVVSTASDPDRPENVFETDHPDAILATFVPLGPASPGQDPQVVVEIHTDVAAAAVPIGRPFRLVGLALLGGLAAIYVIQLPLVRRLGRTLRAQNRRLHSLLEQEQQTVEELRDLNRRQAEFLAVTSHELRTPLTSIAGYAKTLMQPTFTDDAASRREFLQAIERQAGRLGGLIENILAVSQLSESSLETASASLPETVRSVLARLGPGAERVDVDIAADLPDVQVDRRLLELAIRNLLDNAIKFSPEGSRCRLGVRLEGGDVLVRVEDDGIGIAQEHVGRIFDRFYQVDSSSTRRHGGVGLGLHLVKAVTEGAGGAIDVQSETGRGTRFALRFPVARSMVQQQSDPRRNQPLPDELQRASMM
jgi:signal transduction histidine kinase